MMDQASDNRTLLAAVGRGEAKAFERLFALMGTRVFRFLLRKTGNAAIAEELLNETFIAAWQSAHTFEGRAEPLTWLLGIANNKAISARRKRQEVSGIDETVAAQIPDGADTPETVALKRDKGEIMRACMAQLSEEHRTILDLAYYQERSIAEASAILSIPEATVKTRMFYARKKLSELMKARGLDRGWP